MSSKIFLSIIKTYCKLTSTTSGRSMKRRFKLRSRPTWRESQTWRYHKSMLTRWTKAIPRTWTIRRQRQPHGIEFKWGRPSLLQGGIQATIWSSISWGLNAPCSLKTDLTPSSQLIQGSNTLKPRKWSPNMTQILRGYLTRTIRTHSLNQTNNSRMTNWLCRISASSSRRTVFMTKTNLCQRSHQDRRDSGLNPRGRPPIKSLTWMFSLRSRMMPWNR